MIIERLMTMTSRTIKWRSSGTRLVAACLVVACSLLPAQLLAATSVLDSVDYSPLPGNQTRIALVFSGPVPAPKSFTVTNPARITLDFPDTQNRLQRRFHEVRLGAVQSISSAQASDRTRVVINLSSMTEYNTSVEGNMLLVTLGSGGMPAVMQTAQTQSTTIQSDPVTYPANPAPIAPTVRTVPAELPIAKTIAIPPPAPVPAPAPVISRPVPTPIQAYTPSYSQPSVAPAYSAGISNIDFRRSPDGAGRVLISLDNPGTTVDIKQQGLKIIADFTNANVSQHLQQRMDVTDFATKVKHIDAKNTGNGSRITVAATGNFSHAAFLNGNVYTIEVRPMSKKQEKVQKREVNYKGERLSLNFQSIEVRSVLQLIADFTGLNVVVSDQVGGEITLRLKDVPWDQALDIIMKTQGLDKRRQGNVLFIDKAENIRQREQDELQASLQIEQNIPLKTEIIALNYSDAGEMSTLLKSGSGENSIMSERGNVTLDKRTNSLLVQDTPAKLEEMRDLINRLDVPVRQVLIESRIVTASDSFSHELGVAFGGGNSNTSGNTTLGSDFDVSLGAASPAGTLGFNLAKIIDGASLDLELSAAEVDDQAEIVASPRIITSNKRKARIEQGVEIPYEEATSSGATNISFKKAVLSLEVTPHITQDDRINMELSVSRDSVGSTYNNVPSIDTREVETQVLVENGQTIVLGGIFEETVTSNNRRVPFFGELPVLGRLFSRDSKTNNKSELLIFVTPRILNGDMSLR